MLKKIISGAQSGAQSGADLASLQVAIEKGIMTVGTIPKGFRTLDGLKPEYATLYGIVEHTSSSYVPRTFQNVKDSDGTIRIAHKLDSSGEKCTLKAINQYGKPYFDVWARETNVYTTPEEQTPAKAAKWIVENNIDVLNVAGNSEQTAPGIEAFAKRYVAVLIDEVRKLTTERVSENPNIS